MELTVIRNIRTKQSTIGDFLINGVKKYNTLEDVDRGLTSDMTLDHIKAIKVYKQTAIPTGRYKVTSYFSAKHDTYVPLVNDVPGFEGIEIHVGNFAGDTDGCLLLGKGTAPDMVLSSREAITEFYSLFFTAIKTEEVYITYK